MTSDFSTNYCSSCDIAVYSDSLYCSTKCRKDDAKRTTSVIPPSTNSPSLSSHRSGSSIYALSNPSTSSIASDKTSKRVSSEETNDGASTHPQRPILERRGSSQLRPLAVKRSSYSSTSSRSVDLVTPTMTPLTLARPESTTPGFTFPILPAGGRFNHNASEEPECRRMFFFKQVQREHDEPDNSPRS